MVFENGDGGRDREREFSSFNNVEGEMDRALFDVKQDSVYGFRVAYCCRMY